MSAKLLQLRPPSELKAARGDLNPILGFCFPLFSIHFPGEFPSGVETSGTGRKQKGGLLWWLYMQKFIVF
jgi:hypothetical protein